MQFMMTVIEEFLPGNVRENHTGSADAAEMAAIDVFNEQLQKDGHWVFAGGLDSPSTATVVDNRREGSLVTDGPFLESKEHLGGFWIIEAPDLDVALKLAAEGSRACNRKIELRPFLEPEL
ncbi:YciI family protein [Psychromicrobium xiongbiense]|uniref:YciI family protein n=1 Tax=Psychromicrobium xiongbiense TaxID=3051184 RepID=UPI0025533026|nr:YciI family protein [Psychromicrobium sp. YIM S02556]